MDAAEEYLEGEAEELMEDEALEFLEGVAAAEVLLAV